MKKSLLLGIACCLFFGLSAQAQLQKGNMYLGGTIGFNGTSSKYSVASSAESGHSRINEIRPELQLGYFLTNSTVVGVGVNYSLTLFETTYDSMQLKNNGSGQSFQLLPFIRKYKALNDHWSIFIHGEIGSGYRWNKSKTIGGDIQIDKRHYWQHNLSVKPGVVYHFPRNGWAIEGYANVLALNAQYLPMVPSRVKQFTLESGLTTDFPSYFAIRVAKYISTAKK